MKRNIAFLLVVSVALAYGAIAMANKGAEPTTDDVQERFSERMYWELMPDASELSSDEIFQKASSLAHEILMPHTALFLEAAKADLAALPKIGIDTAAFDTVANVADSIIGQAAAEMDDKDAKTREALLFIFFRDPVKTAQFIRSGIIARKKTPREMSLRSMIERLGGTEVYALNQDPLKPVIAMKTGPEFFIVHLAYNDKGYYVDEKVQWIRKPSPGQTHDSR
ncbi:MAG: hypothetical protein GVY16_01415 [Planctomycetes bacterium]|nr:hypothetical protein [Planctomycetota bacterium]